MVGRRATSKSRADARPSEETALSLNERVKELSCLYRINQIFEMFSGSPDEVFQRIVELIPPAWQYPGIASARIVLNGRQYETPGFREGRQRQSADVILGGKSRGSVEVVYAEEKLPLNDGPFLKEEQNLLDAIARQIAFIVERRQAEEERAQLQKQLMHADRLATIGQLAAGVAHELNEPLSSILGFAQLAQRNPRLPEETVHDIQRIVTASLHAREVIKKLLLFARKTPTFKGHTNINHIVSEALGLFEHRFENEGIELVCTFCPRMPEMTADAGQLTQVLVNLVVNAIQAMPEGGKLNVLTDVQDQYVGGFRRTLLLSKVSCSLWPSCRRRMRSMSLRIGASATIYSCQSKSSFGPITGRSLRNTSSIFIAAFDRVSGQESALIDISRVAIVAIHFIFRVITRPAIPVTYLRITLIAGHLSPRRVKVAGHNVGIDINNLADTS